MELLNNLHGVSQVLHGVMMIMILVLMFVTIELELDNNKKFEFFSDVGINQRVEIFTYALPFGVYGVFEAIFVKTMSTCCYFPFFSRSEKIVLAKRANHRFILFFR